MLAAVRLVLAGGVYVPPLLVPAMPPAWGDAPVLQAQIPAAVRALLTLPQIDVLGLLLQGKTNLAIAHRLGLGEGTVKHHMTKIFRVLRVHSRVEAVLAAQTLMDAPWQRTFGASVSNDGGHADLMARA
jgi:DNA-binding NarL/FixJ family response regulator